MLGQLMGSLIPTADGLVRGFQGRAMAVHMGTLVSSNPAC